VVRTPRRGEIWWAETERAGRRPYLVLSRDEVIPVVNAVVTAPITRTVRGISSELALSRSDGLPRDCAANFDHVSVVAKSALVAHICTLDPLQMRQACEALRAAVDC
jgi:mRNA interferase MazF